MVADSLRVTVGSTLNVGVPSYHFKCFMVLQNLTRKEPHRPWHVLKELQFSFLAPFHPLKHLDLVGQHLVNPSNAKSRVWLGHFTQPSKMKVAKFSKKFATSTN